MVRVSKVVDNDAPTVGRGRSTPEVIEFRGKKYDRVFHGSKKVAASELQTARESPTRQGKFILVRFEPPGAAPLSGDPWTHGVYRQRGSGRGQGHGRRLRRFL